MDYYARPEGLVLSPCDLIVWLAWSRWHVPRFISLYNSKSRLSALADRAAAGEEIVIAKNGVPRARLVAIEGLGEHRVPANAMGLSYVATDFDAPDPTIDRIFSGDST